MARPEGVWRRGGRRLFGSEVGGAEGVRRGWILMVGMFYAGFVGCFIGWVLLLELESEGLLVVVFYGFFG
jgi:hypothetical protein